MFFESDGEAGRRLAAETKYSIASNLSDGKAFYIDVKGRMPALGRDPEHLKAPEADL